MFEKGDIMETIRNVDVNRLHDFKNHPFKVEMNTELCELMRSIEKEGVLVPLLVRTNPYGDGYEVISGHRRKEAAIWAGETKVPVVIRELDDDQAVVAMVDSNLHRENLKPSEKAFAYKMKLDAMKHQGKHLDSGALAQVGPKFTDGSQLNEKGNNTSTINSNELLARQVGESVAQIKRYIRLTKLIPKILDMVDDGKIAFTIAVELSYLSENEQYELHAVMDLEQCTPSLSQANRIVINSTGTGTLGRVGIYRNTDNATGLLIVPDSHVTVIRSFSCISSHYLYAFMKAHQTELEKKGEGSTNQKELKPLTLKEMLIAVPPLSEQKRIDKSINVAFSHLAIIEKCLN